MSPAPWSLGAFEVEATENPLARAPKPAVRTTDDYLRERKEIEAARRKLREGQGDGEG